MGILPDPVVAFLRASELEMTGPGIADELLFGHELGEAEAWFWLICLLMRWMSVYSIQMQAPKRAQMLTLSLESELQDEGLSLVVCRRHCRR